MRRPPGVLLFLFPHREVGTSGDEDGGYTGIYEIALVDVLRQLAGMGGISADDDRAVEKLEAKLAGLEVMQEEMKTVNAYYRKHKTLDGCPVLSAEEIGKL